MSRPLVTIVLLCFDRPQMLTESLRSLAEQTYPNLEVLIVNNRSDETEAIAAMVAGYPAFRLVAIPFNSGFTGGMNRGLAEATGEFIYLTEDDIVLEKDCVARLVEGAEKDWAPSLSCPLMIDRESGRIRSAGGWFALEGIYRQADYGAGDAVESFTASREITYVPGNMVFARTSYLREIGGFRDDIFIYYDDVELCARVLRGGGKIAVHSSARIYNLDPPSDRPAAALLEFHKIKNLFLIYLLHGTFAASAEFFLRYGPWMWLRSPFSHAGRLRAKALGWVLMNGPRLLRERTGLAGSSPARLRRRLREAF